MSTLYTGVEPIAERESVAPDVSERARAAARVAIGGAALGLLADALLRAQWGINFFLFIAAGCAATVALARRSRGGITAESHELLAACLAFAATFVVRDSPVLQALNFLALVVAVALLFTSLATSPRQTLAASRVRDVVASVIQMLFSLLGGAGPLLRGDLRAPDLVRRGASPTVLAVARGLLIAIPLLVVFGSLFAQADPVFGRLAGSALHFDLGTLVSHVVVATVISWGAAGYFRNAVLASATTRPIPALGISVGRTEVTVALGLMNLLFLAFVLVQLRYFFGGESLVRATVGMSYAEYARRGFFELVWVTLLVLPVLLAAHALLRADDARAERTFRLLASSLLVLLGVIMYSALARMRLYQSAYGLTRDRLYATVCMGWLAVVFVWLSATLLRGNARRFLVGALASGWLALATLDVVDPDTLIVRVNAARIDEGRSFDALYASTLSADAVPALVDVLVAHPGDGSPGFASGDAFIRRPLPVSPTTSVERRCDAAKALLKRWLPEPTTDWRAWNASRMRARRAVVAHAGELRAGCGA